MEEKYKNHGNFKKVRKIEDKKRILDLHNSGLSVPEISKILNYRFNIIRLAITNSGLTPKEDFSFNKEELYKEFKSGKSIKKICIDNNIDSAYLFGCLLKNKLISVNDIKRSNMKYTDDGRAICSKCNNIYEIWQFPPSDKGLVRLTFCYKCRQEQIILSKNANIESFLKNKLNSMKTTKKKEIDISITAQDLIDQWYSQNGKCFYTNEDMIWGLGKGLSRNTLSIDRINPNKGYIKGNFVFCIYKVNTIKNDMTFDELKEWIPDWYNKINIYLEDNNNE